MKNQESHFGTILLASLAIGILSFGFQNCGELSNEASFASIPEETPEGGMEVRPDQIEITPSGCTDSTHPICDGTIDTVRKKWGSSGKNGTPAVYVGATSDNGAVNTNRMRALDPNSDAAAYCANMVYGGFSDWYLPSKVELEAMYRNRNQFGLLNTDYYWSSTEVSKETAYSQSMIPFSNPSIAFSSVEFFKETTFYVRCIRKKTGV